MFHRYTKVQMLETNLSVEFVFGRMSCYEVVGGPLDHFQSPLGFPRVFVRIHELDHSPRNRRYGERHRKSKLHVVTRCLYSEFCCFDLKLLIVFV